MNEKRVRGNYCPTHGPLHPATGKCILPNCDFVKEVRPAASDKQTIPAPAMNDIDVSLDSRPPPHQGFSARTTLAGYQMPVEELELTPDPDDDEELPPGSIRDPFAEPEKK